MTLFLKHNKTLFYSLWSCSGLKSVREGSEWGWVLKWKDRLPQQFDVTHTRYCPCRKTQPIKKLKRLTESLLLSTFLSSFHSCLLFFFFNYYYCLKFSCGYLYMWFCLFWKLLFFVFFKRARFLCCFVVFYFLMQREWFPSC